MVLVCIFLEPVLLYTRFCYFLAEKVLTFLVFKELKWVDPVGPGIREVM